MSQFLEHFRFAQPGWLVLLLPAVLLLILRPDRQDFQGTAVTVDVARRLDVPNLLLVLNNGVVAEAATVFLFFFVVRAGGGGTE